MCSPAFDNKRTVWFVGGRGDQSNRDSDNGGCTMDWWEGECPNKTQDEYEAAYKKIVNPTGGPVIAVLGAAYTADDEDIITKAGAFDDAEIGMIAFVIQNPDPGEDVQTGRYEITDVDDNGNWIECSGINGSGDCTVEVKIGGAFTNLDEACDNTYAGAHSVTIFINRDESLSGSGITLSSGGNQFGNKFKRIIGYNTIPHDMDKGQLYYESPLEILRNGSIDSTKCVTLDGQGGTFDIFTLSGYSDNYIIENIHMTGLTATGQGVSFTVVSDTVLFRNCRFSDMYQGANDTCDHLVFLECYAHNDMVSHSWVLRGQGNALINCVSKLPAGAVLTNIVSVPATVIGCITTGGMYAVRPVSAGSAALVIGNTFYNTTEYGIVADSADSVVAFNNIFCLAPGAVGIYCINGPIVYNDHNCFIESDGTPLTATGTEYSGGEAPVMGAHSVQADPDFVDAANGDFRVRNPAVLRGGRPGPDGKAAVIGAIGQEYQFAERARVMNAGRSGIVR